MNLGSLFIKKLNFLFLLILISSGYCLASEKSLPERIDSMTLLLAETEDPVKHIDLLNEISYQYRRIDPEKVLEYAKKAKTLSKLHNYRRGLAKAYNRLGIGYHRLNVDRDTSIHYYLKSIEIAKEVGEHYTLSLIHI